MLKLISGALVGWTNYCDVYTASDIGDDFRSRVRTRENSITIPTLQEVARKAAQLEKTTLDEKQYIAYEMLACTFLLSLAKDGNDSEGDLDIEDRKQQWRRLHNCSSGTMAATEQQWQWQK